MTALMAAMRPIALASILFTGFTLTAHAAHAQVMLTREGSIRLDAPADRVDDAAARIGSTDKDLTFTPVAPCRVADTRVVGGAVSGNTSRTFLAVAVAAGVNFTFQGGSATDCGVGAVNASAVALNVTTVAPASAGFATVYQAGTTRPLAASLNYAAGAVVNNTVVVGIPNPLSISDFAIYSFATSHYVVDIVGYYSMPEATPASCVATAITTSTLANGANTYFLAPACAAGYQPTMPYCWGGGFPGVFSTGSGLENNIPGGRAFCGWQNNSGASASVSAGALCCRVPGK